MNDSRYYVTMPIFYEEISNGNRELYTEINEVLYINAHTVYLADEENEIYRCRYCEEKFSESD